MDSRSCSKIIVESNINGTTPGHLLIENSVIGLCGWKGIEVWGNYDACAGNDNAHGQLEMYHSTLTHADIGIFAGRRTASSHDRTYAGGIIKVEHDTFRNNYVDIMFSEWSFGGICRCGDNWVSFIRNSYFDTLAGESFCDGYVDNTLDFYDSFYVHFPYDPLCTSMPGTTVPPRCHIVDLSPYTEVWGFYEPWLCPTLKCPKSYWIQNVLDGNTFTGGRNYPCQFIPPHDNYK